MCARQEHVLVILGTERKFGTKKRERKKKIGKDIYLPLRNNKKRKEKIGKDTYTVRWGTLKPLCHSRVSGERRGQKQYTLPSV